jgi:hypothetical protein
LEGVSELAWASCPWGFCGIGILPMIHGLEAHATLNRLSTRFIGGMKRIDLTKEHHSLSEVLTFAESEAVLIHAPSGEDFVLEAAEEFDREVASLGASEKFASFLGARSKEPGGIVLRRTDS